MLTRLVALHGFAGTPAIWERLVPDGVELVAPWLPGHGRRTVARGDFDDVVHELGTELLDRSCVLAGYSLGARLALAMALRFPELVSRLVLIGGTPGIEDDSRRAARRDWDDAQAAAIDDDLEAWVTRWARLPIFASQIHLPPDVLDQQQSDRGAHAPSGLAWAMRTLGQGRMGPLWSALPRLGVQTEFVAGAQDDKYVAIARRAARLAPRATVELVPDSGHNPLIEQPATLRRILALAARC